MTKGLHENIEQTSAKYNILANFTVNGVVEVQDIVGALFGQTEGLLNDLELRELQKSGRIGRIVVNSQSKEGETFGEIIIPSSLDRTETAILAATLETVDRVGPCRASLKLKEIKDLRESKLKQIERRAKELLKDWKAESRDREDITEKINEELERDSIITWKGLPAGAEIDTANNIIIVEGRNDIQQLLKIGVKNTVAVNGTSIPKAIIDLTKSKECTAFLDGDRGGDMILNELLQVSKIKFYARAPLNREVEELAPKELVKLLQQKKPVEHYISEKKMREENDRKDRDSRKFSRSQGSFSRDKKKPNFLSRSSPQRPSRSSRPSRGQKSDRGDSSRGRTSKRDGISLQGLPPNTKTLVKGLISSNEAVGLDPAGKEVLRTSNVKIYDDLTSNIKCVIFDGVVSQRFLNRAVEMKVKQIIAVNHKRNLKIPEKSNVELYYFKDFL